MIRVAVLGAGIGAQHLEAYARLPHHYQPRLLVDRDLVRAGLLKEKFGLRVATDVTESLADPDIDLIDICLPPSLHASVAIDALRSGKHVICEKPFATSLAQARAIEAVAEETGQRVFPVFQYRWGPGLAKLRSLIREGHAGHPRAAALETHWSRGADYYANGWRGTWEVEQGGAVLCHAIHAHDLMTHLMGPVADVSAHVATLVNRIETEDTAAIAFGLANGALATSSICLGAARDETRLRLIFEHVTATSDIHPYAPGDGNWRFEARDPWRQAALDALLAEAPDEPLGFEGFLGAVARDISNGGNEAVTAAEGTFSVELVTAIYHAARTGTRVSLPIRTDDPLCEGWRPQ